MKPENHFDATHLTFDATLLVLLVMLGVVAAMAYAQRHGFNSRDATSEDETVKLDPDAVKFGQDRADGME